MKHKMYDILTAIVDDEPCGLRGKRPMKPPYSPAELRIQRRLEAMTPKTAEAFRREIRALAVEQRDAAFRSGVRFGAQMTAQMLEDF